MWFEKGFWVGHVGLVSRLWGDAGASAGWFVGFRP